MSFTSASQSLWTSRVCTSTRFRQLRPVEAQLAQQAQQPSRGGLLEGAGTAYQQRLNDPIDYPIGTPVGSYKVT